MLKIKIKKIHPNAVIPKYAHEGDTGMDLFSAEDVTIKPNKIKIVGTGLSVELPKNYACFVWDKSGIASKGLINLGGVIDQNYRGEYKTILFNVSDKDYEIKKAQKIAQLLIQKIEPVEIEEVEELNKTSRGEGGFGSTGLK